MENTRSGRPRVSAKVRRRRILVSALLAMAIFGGIVPRILAFDSQTPIPTRVHVVSPGDTLWSLASEYAPDEDPRWFVHEVQLLNDIERAQVFPGQRLTLPPA